MTPWATQAELSPGLLADVQEPVVIEVFLAGHRYESRYNFRFRIVVCGYEIITILTGVEHVIVLCRWHLFRTS